MPWRGAVSLGRGPFRGYGPFAQKLPWGLNRRPTPTLLLDFVGTRAVDSRITFTRSSTATYFDAAGVLQTAAIDTPRIDFDPVTKACRGLLIEEARTNLVSQPCDLTAAGWSASNITAAANQTGPDNAANSASSITATADAGTILFAITSASAARATTAYVKRITGTGAVEMTQDGGSTWAAVTVTSAWTRVSITSATVTNPSVGFRLATNADAIAVFGVQCETGAFATSVIPSPSALARIADQAVMTGTAFSSWFNPVEGTLFAEVEWAGLSANDYYFSINDGSANNLIGLGVNTTPLVRFLVLSAGATQASLSLVTPVANVAYRNAGAYATNDFIMAVGGAVSNADTSGTVPTGMTTMRLNGSVTTSNQLNGRIYRLAYYPARLSNAQMRALTR